MTNPYSGDASNPVGVEWVAVHWPHDKGNLGWPTTLVNEVYALSPNVDWDMAGWHMLPFGPKTQLRQSWPVETPIRIKANMCPGASWQFSRYGDYDGFLGLWEPVTNHSARYKGKWKNVMLLFRAYSLSVRFVRVTNMFDPMTMSVTNPYIYLLMEELVKKPLEESDRMPITSLLVEHDQYEIAPAGSTNKIIVRCHVNTPVKDILSVYFDQMRVQEYVRRLYNFFIDTHFCDQTFQRVPRNLFAHGLSFNPMMQHGWGQTTATACRKPLWKFLMINDPHGMIFELQELRNQRMERMWEAIRRNAKRAHDVPVEVQNTIALFVGPVRFDAFIASLEPRDPVIGPDAWGMQFDNARSVDVDFLVRRGVHTEPGVNQWAQHDGL